MEMVRSVAIFLVAMALLGGCIEVVKVFYPKQPPPGWVENFR